MKLSRILLATVFVLLLIVTLVGCNEDPPSIQNAKTYYTASFNFNNGAEPYTIQLENGSLISPPISPERENYIFNGWKENGKIWDFSENKIYSDLSFAAQWIDASSIFSYSVNDDGTITVTEYRGSLTEIRIPEIISGLTVTAIGDGVFEGLNSYDINVITVPETVTSIGNASFKGCGTVPIKVLGNIRSLGEEAFDGCEKLSLISLDDTITEIPFRAFGSCTSLTEMSIPSSVNLINEDAFSGCSSIKTLLVMSNGFSVADSAFLGCDSLVTVFFNGNNDEWNAIKIDNGGNGNDTLKEANVFFYSEDEPEADGRFWHFNDKGQVRTW